MAHELVYPPNLTEQAPGLWTSGKPCRLALADLVGQGFRGGFIFITPVNDEVVRFLIYRDIPILMLEVTADDESADDFQLDELAYREFCRFLIDFWPPARDRGEKVLVCCDAGINRSVKSVQLFLKNFPHH